MKHVVGGLVLTDSFISLSHSAKKICIQASSVWKSRKSITTTRFRGELVHSPPVSPTKPFQSTSVQEMIVMLSTA